MTGNGPLEDQLKIMIQKAHRSLAAATRLIQEGDYDFASSRAYYAAFYSMEAILLSKNLVFSKHGAVIGAFNEHFVKAGFFPKEFSKFISRPFRQRQIGDYEFEISVAKGEAMEDVAHAQTIVQSVASYLITKGFVGDGA
jgi:uncharacterized protein (UPF0332 family)